MARTARHRKHVARLNAIARERLLLSLKRKGKPLISSRILKLLAAAELPPQKQAYQQKLHELLRE
jgi:hypothetical protein